MSTQVNMTYMTASKVRDIMAEYSPGVFKKSDFLALPSSGKPTCVNILIIGACGVGKTWIMRRLIRKFDCTEKKQVDLVGFISNERGINIVGTYRGATFDGSDKLSRAVMRDVDSFLLYEKNANFNVFEGQRFSNRKFMRKSNCLVFKIDGDGLKGRLKRKSDQTGTHITRIASQVRNLADTVDMRFKNSQDCYDQILRLILS